MFWTKYSTCLSKMVLRESGLKVLFHNLVAFACNMLNYTIKQCKQHSSGGRVCCYAVAVDKRGNIIAEAVNDYSSSNRFQRHYAQAVGLGDKVYSHAETLLISRLYKTNKRCYAVYVSRVDADGNTKPASPCPICTRALEEAGITRIYHT